MSSTAILDPRANPEVNRMRTQVELMCKQKTGVQIRNQKTYDQAVAERRQLQQMLENIDALFEPMRKSAYDAYQAVLKTKSSLHDPVEQAVKQRTRDIITWDQEQAREKEERERLLMEENTRKAEQKRQRQIKAAQKRGDKTAVEALSDAPLDIAPAEVEDTYQKSDSLSTRKTYKCEVTDFYELVKFVAKNKHFIHLLEPNKTEINKLAKAQKDALSVPGLKAVPDFGLANVNRRGL